MVAQSYIGHFVVSLLVPHPRQESLWTQMVRPHLPHSHLVFSFLTNSLTPDLLMFSRFSIMLIPYLVRYLLSRLLSRLHGYVSHASEQCFIFCSLRTGQFRIVHLTRELDLPSSTFLQPRHRFFSRM